MGVLAEYVRKEAEHLRSEAARRDTLLKDWVSAINQLFTTLETWVREADGGIGLLTTTRNMGPIRQEYLLGTYEAPILRIHLGGQLSGRSAEIVPKSRHVAATIKPPAGEEERRAEGMVEIRDSGMATHYLFRLAATGGANDRWFIRDVVSWNSEPGNDKVEDLTPERFEAAILRALR